MLASAASAVPAEDTAAELSDRLNELKELLRGVADAIRVHEEAVRKYNDFKAKSASPLVYDHATSTSRRAPSILAVGPFNTGKSYLLGELLGEMGCDPPDHGFDAYRHHMPLTRYVQCITCFVRGNARVNLCDMPGLFDTGLENEFWQHFVTAVNLVIEHAGPITKVVYVDTFGGNDVSDDDVKRGIYRARSINMLLTDAEYDDVLEVVVKFFHSWERPRAEERQSKVLRFNSDLSAHAAGPIANLACRLTVVGDRHYDKLAGKVMNNRWGCVIASEPARWIRTSIKLGSAVVDACRAQLGTLQDNSVGHHKELTAPSKSKGDALRSKADHLTRQVMLVVRALDEANRQRTLQDGTPVMTSSTGNGLDVGPDGQVQNEITHARDGPGTSCTGVQGSEATAASDGSVPRAVVDPTLNGTPVVGNAHGDVQDTNGDPDVSGLKGRLGNVFDVALGDPLQITTVGIVAGTLTAVGGARYVLKRTTQQRVPAPVLNAPASNAFHKIGMAAGVAAAAGGLITIGANAVKGRHLKVGMKNAFGQAVAALDNVMERIGLQKPKRTTPGEDDREPSAALQVLSSAAMTVACVLAAMA
ncbi:G domain-containing protein [Plasmodiophora brassicae]